MKALIVLLSVLVIPFSNAATLKTGVGVEVLAVDGKEITTSFFSNDDIDLADGMHQVVVRYSNNFKESDQVESKPYIFNVNVKGETEVRTTQFRHQKQAESAIRQGLVWTVTKNGQTAKIASFDTLSGKGYMPYSDIEKVISDYNQAHGISTLTVTPAATTTNQSTTSVVKNTASVGNVKLAKTKQLMQLYKSANKQERKVFRLWLLEQDLK